MPTVQEILAQSGFTPEEIAALDAKKLGAFGQVLTTAEAQNKLATEAAAKAATDVAAAKVAQDAAELKSREAADFWANTITPNLTAWEEKEKKSQEEIASSKALAAYYETQFKTAKASGLAFTDVPDFVPPVAVTPGRDGSGKFVTGAPGSTPGSPTFTIEDVENRLGNGLDNGVWALQEYQRLSGGQFLPDSISTLAQEANANKLTFKDYVARKYDFPAKRAAIQAKADEEKAATIRAEAVAPYEQKLKDQASELQAKFEAEKKTLSERGGNNPDVRRAAISEYPEIKKAVAEGSRKDPLSMSKEERQVEMRRQIQSDVARNEEVKQGAAA